MDTVNPQKTYVQSMIYMDTVVTITVLTARPESEVNEGMAQAFAAFGAVERTCSRFDEHSELRRLEVGIPLKVSPLLFETIRFAWEVADLTNGVFDPTVGHKLEAYGFQHHYLTGNRLDSGLDATTPVSYRDVVLDEAERTILLRKPMILDLGAVAKGLAVDLAMKELSHFEGVVIDAGGDLYVKGQNERTEPWTIGIRHPLQQGETICSLRLSNVAVCTSGSYERISHVKEETHHLIHPESGRSPAELVSCTVIAPYAMMADAFSTAAFLLGPSEGIALLEQVGLDGLLITPSLEIYKTKEIRRYEG